MKIKSNQYELNCTFDGGNKGNYEKNVKFIS